MRKSALVLALILVTSGCHRKAEVETPQLLDKSEVNGLAAGGAGPLLSWTAPKGGETYSVTVNGGGRSWLWQGPGTGVIYGTIEDRRDTLVAPNTDSPRQFVVPKAGEKYRWLVTAFDGKGDVVAISKVSEFTYAEPADKKLPPRAPRGPQAAVYDCDALLPQAVRTKWLPAYEMESSSPCGNEPRLGCPWSCTFKSTTAAGRRRTNIYYDCNEASDAWPGFPKDAQAKPAAGVGRHALLGKHGEHPELLWSARNVSFCVVKLQSDLPETEVLELGKAVDAALTPSVIGFEH